jgi:hypothetical protein
MIGNANWQYSAPIFVPDSITVLVPGRQYASFEIWRLSVAQSSGVPFDHSATFFELAR